MLPETFHINIYSLTILAFEITFPINSNCYFIIDETFACLIKHGVIEMKWSVLKISYDSNGGEILTKEGDTIYLSKEILIKKTNGEEISLEYKPINVDKIVVNARNS